MGRSSGGRSVREGVVLVALGVALLCVATWSAARSTIGGTSTDIPANVRGGQAVLNDALLIAAGAVAAVIAIFVAPELLRQGRGRAAHTADDDEPGRTALWLRLLGGVTVILVIALAIMLAARNRPEQTQPLLVAPPTTETIRPAAEGDRAGARGWSATALFAAGAIAVGAAVVVWHRRGRVRGPVDYVDGRGPTQPSTSIDLDALDPADAVRAAYAAARTAIEPLGVSLRAPETPYEYLDRVRATAPRVERAVATLTRLFEVARFSHHPVTVEMKAEAIAAYAAVAAEVALARAAAQQLAADQARDAAVLT